MITRSFLHAILKLPKSPAAPALIYTVPASEDQHQRWHLLHMYFTSDAAKTEVTVTFGSDSVKIWIPAQGKEQISICVPPTPQDKSVTVVASRDDIYLTGYVSVSR